MDYSAHNEDYELPIFLPDFSGSNQPIKRIGFELRNVFHFPFLERDRATFGPFMKAIHKPGFIRRIAAIAASHCSLELIQPRGKAHRLRRAEWAAFVTLQLTLEASVFGNRLIVKINIP